MHILINAAIFAWLLTITEARPNRRVIRKQNKTILNSTVLQQNVLSNGYTCVLPGTCTSSIDLRLVTTSENIGICPRRFVSCLVQPEIRARQASQCGTTSVESIDVVDGDSTPGAYPWQAYIVGQNGYLGSGVLLDEWHVLTAAHKIYQNKDIPSSIGVHLGIHETTNLTTRLTIESILVHPDFNSANLFNDLALIRLNEPVTPLPQRYVNTACLPAQEQSFVGRDCWVSGWGSTGFQTVDLERAKVPTLRQRQVRVPVVSGEVCRTAMRQILGDVDNFLDPLGEICAGGEHSKDACTNDGGSPLVCGDSQGRFVVAGLVLWGKGCGQQGVYGVYVNVSHYIDWINSAIETLEDTIEIIASSIR